MGQTTTAVQERRLLTSIMKKILLVILLGLHLSMGHFRKPWHPKLRANKYNQLKQFRPSPKISDTSWKISYHYGNGVFRSYPTKSSGHNNVETTKHEKGS